MNLLTDSQEIFFKRHSTLCALAGCNRRWTLTAAHQAHFRLSAHWLSCAAAHQAQHQHTGYHALQHIRRCSTSGPFPNGCDSFNQRALFEAKGPLRCLRMCQNVSNNLNLSEYRFFMKSTFSCHLSVVMLMRILLASRLNRIQAQKYGFIFKNIYLLRITFFIFCKNRLFVHCKGDHYKCALQSSVQRTI